MNLALSDWFSIQIFEDVAAKINRVIKEEQFDTLNQHIDYFVLNAHKNDLN